MNTKFLSTSLCVTLYFILDLSDSNEAARILAVFPTPSISHQITFRPMIQELVKRGHIVTLITPDPAFPKGQTPSNLTEIDVHDISYKIWQHFLKYTTGKKNDLLVQILSACAVYNNIFENQMQAQEVQKIFNDENQKFDLLLMEEILRPALALTHKYKVPTILISSFGSIFGRYANLGAPVHPLLYPTMFNQRIYNLTIWEKITELYNYIRFTYTYYIQEETENELVRRIFGSETPSLSELSKNVDMLFVNVHAIWDGNRPVPPNVIYLGNLHQSLSKELTQDLKSYLDSSITGVIYLSFGTNTNTENLPRQFSEIIVKVFSKLPYDVIMKWDSEELKDKPKNVKIMKWVPQAVLLMHPKIKLFITQGGQQSTDESITAGVPLIGIPMSSDQWFNTEKYAHHKIGMQLTLETITEEKFMTAIETVIKDKSYRINIAKLRELMNDQPQTPLERAIWWTEHVLRHGGARHLRSSAANLSWIEILEIELVATVLVTIMLTILLVLILAFTINSFARSKFSKNTKMKRN